MQCIAPLKFNAALLASVEPPAVSRIHRHERYRVYFLSQQGHIIDAAEFYAADDATGCQTARALSVGQHQDVAAFELWSLQRLGREKYLLASLLLREARAPKC